MNFLLENRTCLITGASSGIGRATAICVAREGARVVATARTLEPLESLAVELKRHSSRDAVTLAADLDTRSGCNALISDALGVGGGIDVLVNCAGGSRPYESESDEASWSEAFMLNFTSVRRLTMALVSPMRDRHWGRVVNVTGAILAKSPNAATPAKAAMESWSKAASALYAPDGVTVNCVAPGRINSRQILDRIHPTEKSRQAYISANIPAGRFGEPEEAAAVIAFLASAQASYVTGATIPVDGGAMRLSF